MYNFLFKLILIILVVKHATCGQIFSGEPILDYSNARYLTQIHLKFELETSLHSTDFVKFIFPFALHTKLTASSNRKINYSHPQKLFLSWNLQDEENEYIYENDQPGIIYTESIDSSTYYLQFFNDDYNQYNIQAGDFVTVKFNITDSSQKDLQKSGELLQINAQTVSGVDKNALVYDKNPTFGYIYLQADPNSQLDVLITYKEPSEQYKLNYEHTIYIDTTVYYDVNEFSDIMRIVYQLSDNSFIFKDTCQSIAKTTVPKISILQSEEYSCYIDEQKNELNFYIKNTVFLKQTSFRFQVNILSPTYIVSDIDLIGRLLYNQSTQILSEYTLENVFTTKPINIADHQIYLSHGLRPDALLPFDLKFVRGNEAETYFPYNAVKIEFELDADTPQEQELIIELYIKAEQSAFLLKNSIVENLPAATNKVVSCMENDKDKPNKRRITCQGIGKLTANQKYHIAFRIYLPYDVYEPDIQMEEFGVLQISTAQTFNSWDQMFIIGRDPLKKVQIASNKDIEPLKGIDASDYIEYLKSFSDIYLAAIAQDFPDYDEEVLTNFYESDMGVYGDIFVPKTNLAFLNYVKDFNSVWILKQNLINPLETLDIIKKQHVLQLTEQSVPKNIFKIPSVNGKDWQSNAGGALLSSKADHSSDLTYEDGFLKSASDQMIILNTKIPFSDITSFDDTTNTDFSADKNCGILFLMNPNIVPSATEPTNAWMVPIPGDTSEFDATYSATDDGYNAYTFFQLTIKNSDVILDNIAQSTATDMIWGIRSFVIDLYGSTIADQYLLDFYITTVDRVDGANNLKVENSYVLITGLSLDSSAFPTVELGISNYWSSTTNGVKLTGQYAPTIFKLIETSGFGTSVEKIALFFDQGSGFYENFYQNKGYCSIDTAVDDSCRLIEGSDQINIDQYDTLNSMEVNIQTPAQQHSFIFPIKVPDNISSVTFYIVSYESHPDYPDKPYYKINGAQKYSTTFTFTPDSSTITLPYYTAGNSGANFGPDSCGASECTVGQTETKALEMSITTSSITSDINSSFTYLADYIFNTGEYSSWGNGGSLTYPCIPLQYQYISSDESNIRYGVHCILYSGSATAATTVQPDEFIFETHFGLKINAYGSISDENGDLAAIIENTNDLQNPAEFNTFSGISISEQQKRDVLEWDFTNPITISRDFIIKIYSSTALPFSQSSNSECSLQIYDGELDDYQYLDADCETQISDTKTLLFTFTNLKQIIEIDEQMKVLHYGVNTDSSLSDVDFYISYIYSNNGLSTDFIADSSTISQTQTITIDSAISESDLILSDFTINTLSKNAMSIFSFKFTIQSKSIWPGEIIIFDLGQFASKNQYNVEDLECQVLDYGLQIAHEFEILTLGNLKDVTLQVKQYYDGESDQDPQFFLQCQRFFIPTSDSPVGISAQYLDVGGTTIFTSTELSLPTFDEESPAIFQNSVQKYLATPGSNLELIFNLKVSTIELDSKARIIIIFPKIYNVKLSRDNDIYCSLNNIQLGCQVTYDRTLEIKYFQETIAQGEEMLLIVKGVTQPLNYKVGQFFIAFDQDYDDSNYQEYGQFEDQALDPRSKTSSLKSTIDIRSFEISSYFLNDDDVEYEWIINYPSTFPNLESGSYILINFPLNYKNILNDLGIICQIKQEDNDVNYVGQCLIKGLQIQLITKQQMNSGFNYVITISNLRNPQINKPYAFKWIIEIANNDLEKISYKGTESTNNFVLEPFLQDPEKQYLHFEDENGNELTEIKIIKGVLSQKIYIKREEEFKVFSRSFMAYSSLSNIKCHPKQVEVNVGTVNKYFQIYSNTKMGEFYLKLTKVGDGNFFANLPVLKVIFDDRNQEEFRLTQNEASIYKSELGNYLFYYSLNCLYPTQGVYVEFYLPSDQSGKGVQIWESENAMTINYLSPHGSIPLTITDLDNMIIGDTFNVYYRIGGTNNDQYTLTDQPYITFTILTEPSSTSNSVTLSLGTTNYNSQEITVQCSQVGAIYYQFYLSYWGTQCFSTTKQLFTGAWQNTTRNDLMYNCENQYGIMDIKQENTDYTVQLNSLKSKSDYKFVAYCLSSTGVQSETKETTFTTQDNQGKLIKIQVDFVEYPSKEQRKKLACFFALYFNAHPEQVSTNTGEICTEVYYTLNEKYNYRRILLDGLENCSDPTTISFLSDGSYTTYYYISANNYADIDDIYTRAISATSLECFKDFAYQNSNGIPELINIQIAQEVDNSVPSITNEPKIYLGWTWASIDKMTLSPSGKVFASIELKGEDPDYVQPSVQQVVHGLFYNNTSSQGSTNSILVGSQDQFNGTFSNLQPGTGYYLYYVVGQESPFEDIILGSVNRVEFTTYEIFGQINQAQYFSVLFIILLLILI